MIRALNKYRGNIDPDSEYRLFRRNLQIGADGSILQDLQQVYVLNIPFAYRANIIDYFHGMRTVPIAQTFDDFDVEVWHMIPLHYNTVPGNLTRRIIAIQRLWRRTWKYRHHNDLIELAFYFRELYAKSRREGIIIPSLDYDQKVAARRYGGARKHHRAFRRKAAHRARLLDGSCECDHLTIF